MLQWLKTKPAKPGFQVCGVEKSAAYPGPINPDLPSLDTQTYTDTQKNTETPTDIQADTQTERHN